MVYGTTTVAVSFVPSASKSVPGVNLIWPFSIATALDASIWFIAEFALVTDTLPIAVNAFVSPLSESVSFEIGRASCRESLSVYLLSGRVCGAWLVEGCGWWLGVGVVVRPLCSAAPDTV